MYLRQHSYFSKNLVKLETSLCLVETFSLISQPPSHSSITKQMEYFPSVTLTSACSLKSFAGFFSTVEILSWVSLFIVMSPKFPSALREENWRLSAHLGGRAPFLWHSCPWVSYSLIEASYFSWDGRCNFIIHIIFMSSSIVLMESCFNLKHFSASW